MDGLLPVPDIRIIGPVEVELQDKGGEVYKGKIKGLVFIQNLIIPSQAPGPCFIF